MQSAAPTPAEPCPPEVGETIELNMHSHRPTAFRVTAHIPGGFIAEITQEAPKGKRWDLRAVPNHGRIYLGDTPLTAVGRTTRHLKLRYAQVPA